MGIFKKTIKYSKPSTEIDNKIKDLNEGLKKTKSTSLEQKFSVEEVEEILSEEVVDIENWREIFDEDTVSTYQEKIDEVRERHNDLIKVQGSIEYVKNKEVKEIFEELYKGEVENVVDSYVKKYSNDIVDLREDLFREIKKKPTIDLKSLEEKINFLTLKYNQLSEGLLEEPTTGLEDAITLEQLKNHYQLLVSRLQEQLATLGGGGIEDAPKYDSNSGNLESSIFVRQAQKWKKFGEVGVVTFQGVHVDPTGVGLTYTEDLVIGGNARVTGILSIGTASIVLDPDAGSIGGLSEINANTITAGSATFGGNVTIGGTLTYDDVTNIDSIGLITARDGISVSGGGIDVVSGVVTATSFDGDGSSLSGVITSIVAGSNITVTTSGGISTISSSGGGGGSAGIVVQEEGLNVGTAGTINFVGTGVTATFANGIATVTISSDGGSGFSGDYNDLTNKPTIPSDTGDLTNNAGFVTFTNVSQLNNDSGFVTFTKVSQLTNDSNYITAASTFSGDYNDLTNTPTIPSDTGDLTNNVGFITSGASGAGLTALTGASQGTYGNSTNVPQITVDANGRITQIGLVGISGGGGGGGVAGINIFNGSTSLGVTTHLAFGDNVTATSIGNTISVDVTGVVTSLVGYATEGYVDNAVAISTFSGDYNDLTNTPTIPTNNNQLTNGAGFVTFTNVSQLNNDSNYITAASTFSGNYNDLSNKPTIPSDTGDLTNNAGFVTFTNVSQLTNDSGYITAASTFSGNYNDLSNKPTIPSDTGDLTNNVGFITAGASGAGLTALTGASQGTYGNSNNTAQITVDANGRITAISQVGISGGGGGGVAGITIFNGSTSLGVSTHLSFGDNLNAVSAGNTISVSVTGVVTSLVGYATEGYVDNAVAISTFSGDYNDLTNKPTIPTNNNQLTNGAGFVTFTNVSQLNNDSNYITAASTFSGNYNDLSNKPTIPSDTGDLTNSVGFVTSGGTVALSQGLTGTPNITVGDIVANNVSIAQTLTYEDVTNIDSIGLITARSGIIATGVVTATSFVKSSNSGGFLKADGTEDTSTYLTSVSPTNTDIQGMWSVGGNTSGYTFTGPGQDGSEYNPDIYLVRGQRYRFVNSLGSNHPFEFRNAANNADYTDGITGSQSGTQDFNVQHDAPPVLKYRCTIHTVSMLGTIYIIGGTQVISGIVTATGFSTTNGTSSQFLKADGSVDSSTYLTSETQTLNDVLGLGNTSSTGLSVGVVTATSFSGSGAGLTNIPSSQLTGALPAIDGSALTGVTASGTGIVVQEEGSSVGTAGTINFVGTGVTATFVNGIATVTISSSSGGSSNSGITTATGTFTASAGVAYTANTYGVNTYVNSEYTLFFQHSTGIQSQKVLVMDDGSTAYSQEYGIMYSNDPIISVGATVKSGNVELWWTPETGVSGIVTYSYRRSVL